VKGAARRVRATPVAVHRRAISIAHPRRRARRGRPRLPGTIDQAAASYSLWCHRQTLEFRSCRRPRNCARRRLLKIISTRQQEL
jgi:hypothetical protein